MLINPCNVNGQPVNTGSDCNAAMKATALIFLVPVGDKWTKADIVAAGSFTAFALARCHAAPSKRWFPIFGTSAPVRNITDTKEADVLETMEDGSVQFIRYGMYNRMYLTTQGGLALAQSLMNVPNRFSFVDVDIIGQVQNYVNPDGSYSGIPTNLVYGPAPELANLKTSYKNSFYLSFSPNVYIKKAQIFQSTQDEDVLSVRGLFDSIAYQGAANAAPVGGTRAQGGFTIVKGNTADTIDVKVNGISISGGPVIQTGTETTDTLLAAKVAAAITAAVAANGGYTAVNAAGVLTVSAPLNLGAPINGTQPTATVVGTITGSTVLVPFAGGVTGTIIIKVSIKTRVAETDLVDQYGVTLVNAADLLVTNSAGAAIVPTVFSITPATPSVPAIANLTVPYLKDTLSITGAPPAVLFAANMQGFEIISPAVVIVS